MAEIFNLSLKRNNSCPKLITNLVISPSIIIAKINFAVFILIMLIAVELHVIRFSLLHELCDIGSRVLKFHSKECQEAIIPASLSLPRLYNFNSHE